MEETVNIQAVASGGRQMASGILPNDNPERASLTLNFGLRDLWYGTAFSETATKAVSALQIIAVDVGYAMVEKTSCSLWPQCRPREFLRYATEDRPRQEHRLPQHAEANRRPCGQIGQAASGTDDGKGATKSHRVQ